MILLITEVWSSEIFHFTLYFYLASLRRRDHFEGEVAITADILVSTDFSIS